MNQIAEHLCEITLSPVSLILKKATENRLEVIAISGSMNYHESELLIATEQYHKLVFPINKGSQALFVRSFNENLPMINNELTPLTSLPLPDMKKALYFPIRYGKEAIGELILANREDGYCEYMFPSLVTISHALGQLMKMNEEFGKVDSDEVEYSRCSSPISIASSSSVPPLDMSFTSWTDSPPAESLFSVNEDELDMDNELLKSAELSLALFKGVQDGIIILDRDMNILSMNPSSKLFFGVELVVPTHISELIPENSAQKLDWSEIQKRKGVISYKCGKLLAKCRTEPMVPQETHVQDLAPLSHSPIVDHSLFNFGKKKDDNRSSLIPISLSISSFFYKHEPYYSLTVTDLSSKEDVKDKLRFLSYLSHELRSPIQVVVSGIQCLLDLFKDEQELEFGTLLKSLTSSADLVNVTINDMIDLTKLESGHMKVLETSFLLKEKIDHLVNICSIYERENLKLFYNFDENIPNQIYTDSPKLQQILLNIMTSSCKFTTKGSVTLACKWNGFSKPVPTIDFIISDTGSGIEPEELSKLFTMYRRLDRKQQSNIIGSGIGLALSKMLCDILGYSIRVESERNIGTRFTISVPCDMGKLVTSEPEKKFSINTSPESTLKEKRVLIVDDNEIIRKFTKNILKMCHCEDAENGLEAVKKCERRQFDVVIMDIVMPVMNGVDAIKSIRKLGLTIPILALTGNSLDEDIEGILAVGANRVLLKPINRNELLKELTNYIR